jgi:6-pyruvoyltetrahydropterin/6-carboxytetrahydropterin synthase
VDFAALAPFESYLQDAFDHRDLNAVLDVPPTSENLARLLYQWCMSHLSLPAGVSVAAVRVAETSSTFAEYTQARP